MALSIVFPYFNPPNGWEHQVTSAYKELRAHNQEIIELIVVNDGSSDPQDKALQFLRENIPDLIAVGTAQNKGKGAALRLGVSKAQYPKIIYTDIDFPYTVDSFILVWKALEEADVVIGVKDKDYYQHLPALRVGISRALKKMIGLFFRMPISDTQCGLKGFNEKGKAVFLKTSIKRYLCDLEFVYLSYRQQPKLTIVSREVSLRKHVAFGSMNLKILFTESFNFLKILNKK